MSNPHFNHQELIEFSTQILTLAGLENDRARTVATTLVEADLMGHTTHGLYLLSNYVRELESGGMAKTGEFTTINDSGSAITWDGRYLPGPWLVHRAIDLALDRVTAHPVVSVCIQKCHHIGCLAAYPERATDKDLLMLLTCSDPINKTIAPFGGMTPQYSPNPIAAGIPTETDPIIFDISTSATANGLVARTHKEGQRLSQPWLMDADGNPTDDPAKFFEDPPATILPLGGLDSGYKGFALAILVEALTNALGGFGRVAHPTNWGCSVFMQIINPEAFGGKQNFLKEMQFFSDQTRKSKPRKGHESVRLPGSRALRLRENQRKDGLTLYPGILPMLEELGAKYRVRLPGS